MLSAVLLAAAPAADAWWNRGWEYRAIFDAAGGRSSEVGCLAFHHAGRVRPDGRDLRVVASGASVRLKVLQSGPGTFLRIAFETKPGSNRYCVYYGNPSAKAAPGWSPGAGLVLETRRFNGGSPRDLQGMRQVVAKSGPSFGADFVPGVFHGFNPFGPPDRYVSVYTGWLNAPRTGDYVFCTSSDDASFVQIDGKHVVGWPGWHGAVGDTRHQKTVDLKAGRHKLEYLHVNGGGPGIAVCAWKPPGEKRIWPIQPEAFGLPVRAGLVRVESQSGPVPDFQPEVVGELAYADGRCAVRCRFGDPTGQMRGKVRWDFGDGLSAQGPRAEHVYLRRATYTVRASGQGWQLEQRISADRLWSRQEEKLPDSIGEYAKEVGDYDFGKLEAASLEAAFELLSAAGEEVALEKLCRETVERKDAPEKMLHDAAVWLAHKLRESPATRKEAVSVLHDSQARLKGNMNLRAKLLREIGDILFYYERDLDAALRCYDDVVSRYAEKLEENIVRVTKIKIGDIYRKKGDYEDALRRYKEAEKFKLYTWSEERAIARKGMLVHAAEDYIERAKRDPSLLDKAYEQVSILEWEYPAEKLRGYTTILLARIAVARKDYDEAAKQLLDLVNVNPGSPYADQALYVAAFALRKLGRTDEALAVFRRIYDDYPDSEHHAEAASRLGMKEGGNE